MVDPVTMIAVGALAGAVTGYAVRILFDKVLEAFKRLKNKSRNVKELEDLLERLESPVKTICDDYDRVAQHPAHKWLTAFRAKLQGCHMFLEKFKKKEAFWNSSREAEKLQDSIRLLLSEVPLQQWASVLSTIKTSKADPRSKEEILSASNIPEPKVTFGGEAVAQNVMNRLLSSDCKKWIALHGMGGIGKTFTASKVYHDSKIRKHFSGGMFWLTVSKQQQGPNHFFKQLLEQIKVREPDSQLSANFEAAQSDLKKKLDKERVLLVLDDVWDADVLKHLDVISEKKKGAILITTREKDILRGINSRAEIFPIPLLESEASWELFSYHAFCHREVTLKREVEDVAKQMAEECKGLPLALEVIGSTMAGKELLPDEEEFGQTALRVWQVSLKQLQDANNGNELDALYSKLQLSVDNLLKYDVLPLLDCFFYFAAFPEDDEVLVEELVRLWIAEGLVVDDVNGYSAEEKARKVLGLLSAKSMIQVINRKFSDVERKFCKVHDVLRNLAFRNLNCEISTGKKIPASARKCLYDPGLHLSGLPEGWTGSADPYKAQRLSLRKNDLRQFPGPGKFSTPDLRVLILSGNRNLESLSTSFFRALPKLKVLDLSRTGIKRITGKLLRRLKSLVMLDLTGCIQLKHVSDQIRRLTCLEFLLLEECTSLEKLPEVNSLTKLKVYRTNVLGVSFKDRVKFNDEHRCKWLQRLHASADGAVVADVAENAGWRVTYTCYFCGSSSLPSRYLLPASLRQLELSYSTTTDADSIDHFDLSSLGFLQELRLKHSHFLKDSGSAVRGSVKDLRSLKILDIDRCSQTTVRALGELPSLEDLTIRSLKEDECDVDSEFPSLEKFHLECMSEVKSINFYPKVMPKVKSVILSGVVYQIHGMYSTTVPIVFHPGTMPQVESLILKKGTREKGMHASFPASIAELHTLRCLELRSPKKSLEMLNGVESIFEVNSLTHLEHLILPSRRLVKSLPRHLLEKEQEGQLTIRFNYDHDD